MTLQEKSLKLLDALDDLMTESTESKTRPDTTLLNGFNDRISRDMKGLQKEITRLSAMNRFQDQSTANKLIEDLKQSLCSRIALLLKQNHDAVEHLTSLGLKRGLNASKVNQEPILDPFIRLLENCNVSHYIRSLMSEVKTALQKKQKPNIGQPQGDSSIYFLKLKIFQRSLFQRECGQLKNKIKEKRVLINSLKSALDKRRLMMEATAIGECIMGLDQVKKRDIGHFEGDLSFMEQQPTSSWIQGDFSDHDD